MIDRAYLTKHERGVILAALRDYHTRQHAKSIKQADARDRAQAGANTFVAGDLIRQLTC